MFTPHKALITGGAGFIGCNLAIALAKDGCQVTILDDLSRPGSAHNAANLPEEACHRFIKADIREAESLWDAVSRAEVVYHLAAQTAVTRSLLHPVMDFEINAGGTFNVLETARQAPRPPIVFYASTNKVYGDLATIPTIELESRHVFSPIELTEGIAEYWPMNLQTPYACSKGAGDMYALDYASSYGLRTVVFRQSCIYGPWQNGSEDQGWVHHFLESTRRHSMLRIYGDGKQVRDLLYVDDLISAIAGAIEHIDTTAGQAYNIGGGEAFALSIKDEFWQTARPYVDRVPAFDHLPWRKHDQKVYISDNRKATYDFGWTPQTPPQEGISRMMASILAVG